MRLRLVFFLLAMILMMIGIVVALEGFPLGALMVVGCLISVVFIFPDLSQE